MTQAKDDPIIHQHAGDPATYQRCTDPTCPDRLFGYEHDHLIMVQQADSDGED